MCDLSSLTRDQTHAPAILTTGPQRSPSVKEFKQFRTFSSYDYQGKVGYMKINGSCTIHRKSICVIWAKRGKENSSKENLVSALGGGRSSQKNKKQKTRLVSATIFRVARLRTKKELKSLRRKSSSWPKSLMWWMSPLKSQYLVLKRYGLEIKGWKQGTPHRLSLHKRGERYTL